MDDSRGLWNCKNKDAHFLCFQVSNNGGSGQQTQSETGNEVKVMRSISDVVKSKGGVQQQLSSGSTSSGSGQPSSAPENPERSSKEQKTLTGRKTKEERRISNRQKLLTIAKRHSGFLKRPEILETVYSVEEDGEGQGQAQGQKEASSKDSTESSSSNKGNEDLPNRESQKLSGQPGDSPSFLKKDTNCVLTSFRYRLDSDMTGSDIDYSTDDDSTRIFYSETTDPSLATSCSQPCSRRSSYGGACSLPCSRRSSYGHTSLSASGGGGALGSMDPCQCACCSGSSLNASRRSSYGSHVNLSNTTTTSDDNESEIKVQTAFNRIMSNHRSVTKPKDVKFKRINKSKSRSLEELRGKLKWQVAPGNSGDYVVDDKEDAVDTPVPPSFGEEILQKIGGDTEKTQVVVQQRPRPKFKYTVSLDHD